MNNSTAVVIGVLILGFFLTDYFFFDGDVPIFLGRKLVGLIETMAFWR